MYGGFFGINDANGFDGVFPVLVLPNGVFKNILASPSLKGPSPKRLSALFCLLLLLPKNIFLLNQRLYTMTLLR